MLLNLAVNARDAMPEGGRLAVETRAIELARPPREGLPAGSYVRLSVADSGCGMDTDTQARIFEPFFTTKPEGEGSGLGLATVHGIVTQSAGAITVSSAPGRGTTFDVLLPATDLAAEPKRPDQTPAAGAGAGETILLAEDEPMLRELAALLLTEAGYTVLPAEHGEAALTLADQHAGSIDLLITDVVMPRMNGPELAERLRTLHPGIRVLFVSGYQDRALAGRGIRDRDAVLEKPFSDDQLRTHVRRVLGSSNP